MTDLEVTGLYLPCATAEIKGESYLACVQCAECNFGCNWHVFFLLLTQQFFPHNSSVIASVGGRGIWHKWVQVYFDCTLEVAVAPGFLCGTGCTCPKFVAGFRTKQVLSMDALGGVTTREQGVRSHQGLRPPSGPTGDHTRANTVRNCGSRGGPGAHPAPRPGRG